MSCNDKNSLAREGTSLFNRVLSALDTNYAKVDERTDADHILFAKKYAAYLNYYDASNTLTGDWQTLMQMDVCVALAELFRLSNRKLLDYKQLLYKKIKLASLETSDADINTTKQFKFLFDFIFSLAKLIDEQYRLIPDALNKKENLSGAIKNKIATAFTNLIDLYDQLSSVTPALIPAFQTVDDDNVPIHISSSGSFDKNSMSSAWTTTQAYPLPNLLLSIPQISGSVTAKDQVVWIINHNLFNAQVDNLLNGIASLTSRAAELFNDVIADYPKHSPHYALFISFIKLFRIAKDDLNRYTQRHLDFYYKDVLQLNNKASKPDRAHLVFELQKNIEQLILPKNTLFKGGKDILGKEISYVLSEDIVVNKASVEKLHAWQLSDDTSQKLKAAVIANADDGKTPKLNAEDKSWFAFGDPRKTENAAVGFGIASNILYLKEGIRTITCTVNFTQEIPGFKKYAPDCFEAKLTGDKGWHLITSCHAEFLSAKKIKFQITLEADDPAIIRYDEKIHQSKLAIALPLLQICFKQSDGKIPYLILSNKKISGIETNVHVTGMKSLELSNDNGAVDSSKPFKPFGNFPTGGSSFYIGSREIFQKNLDYIDVNFQWNAGSDLSLDPGIAYLSKQQWKKSFNLSGNRITFSGNDDYSKAPVSFEENEPLRTDTIEGFLRLQLNEDRFSYSQYLSDIAVQMNKTKLVADDTGYALSVDTLPVPKEIILQSISLDYFATAEIQFEDHNDHANDLLFHFTPFGYYEVHPRLVINSAQAETVQHISLFPGIIHAGELFIGLANAAPSSVVNILIQVADGSSNPLKDMETISWYYLVHGNNWLKFENQHIIDRTNNLTQSGIVTVTLPHKISNDNTSFEKGLHWIKASILNNTDAVCKIIVLQSQAALVQLQEDNNKQIEFRKILPPGSITKLVTGNAAIKNITQPFDSFDGRVREVNDLFYTRVSERLRHKQRSINIWDYEHLILEEFPSLFKVKCLNHSGFYEHQGKNVFCEHYPGHVTIITIPDQRKMTNINRLKPYTPIRILNNINEFLKTKQSPFVKLHVKTPQFEEIQLDFNVQFRYNMDETFYLQLLNTEIEQFLCPWAFDTNKEISFGGKIEKSVLLNFVEERPYVDHVTCFKMHHVIERNGNIHVSEKQDVEEATASTSRSLLVSYYNEENKIKHKIKASANCDC